MTRDECADKATALDVAARAAEKIGNVGIAYRCRRMAHLLREMAAGNLHVKTAYDEACADFEAFVAAGNAETIDLAEALREIRAG